MTANGKAEYERRLESEARTLVVTMLAMLVYSTVLFVTYRDMVSPRYGYLPYRAPEMQHYWLAFGITVALALTLPRKIRKSSDIAQWVLFLLAQAPMIMLAQYMDRMTPNTGLVFALEIAACTLLIRGIVAWTPRPPGLVRPSKRRGSPSPWLWLGLAALAIYALMIIELGLPTHWVSITNVYDTRAEYSAALAPVAFLGYLIPALTNAINPAFIAYGIYSLRWRWLIAGVAGQFLVYLMTGSKFVLFSSLALVSLTVLFRINLRMRGTRLFWAISVACLAVAALDRALGSFLWTDMFIRRFVIIPGGLALIYADSFMGGERPHGHFTDTPVVGDWLGSNPYPRGVSYMIGQSLTGNPETQANVSIFGNGYYQAGFIGMLIECSLLALIFVAFDWTCRGLPVAVSALLVFMPTVVLSATNVVTAVTSHGILAALLVSAILPATGWGRPTSPHLPTSISRRVSASQR